MESIWTKMEALQEHFRKMRRAAVAFSSGVDSAFLLKAAHDVLGDDAIAITARSGMFPEGEADEAAQFCAREGIRQITVDIDALSIEGFSENPPDRCYRCKKVLFTRMKEAAAAEGFEILAEGSNLDDLGDYRPGLRALAELGIVSPLREAGLTKAEIRELSKELMLPMWDKPAYACLASRVAYGERITAAKLQRIDRAEAYLHSIGFRQIRVRVHGDDLARIESLPEEFERLASMRGEIAAKLKEIGFLYAALDLTGYRTGSMNAVLDRRNRDTK